MKETIQALKSLGWSITKDDVGDKMAVFVLPDRNASIFPVVRKLSGGQQLSTTLSMTTEPFSKACMCITGPGYGSHSPLVRAWKGLRVIAPEIMETHVQQFSDEAIAWTKEQDVDKALKEHAALSTDAPGARPIWHLAALALLGEIEKLKSYQASFAAGDRLGFVPYISKDFIDRSVELAEEVIAGEV